MRSITKEEVRLKKEKRNKTIIGIVLVVVMTLSTVGYSLFSREGTTNSGTIKYNNIEFTMQEDGLWHFIINNNEFTTTYNPLDVKNITNNVKLNLGNYQDKPLYFYYLIDSQSENEIARNIGQVTSRMNYACFAGENCIWAEKNCISDNIVIVKNLNETIIRQEDKCAYISYNESDNLKTADSFIFRVLGII